MAEPSPQKRQKMTPDEEVAKLQKRSREIAFRAKFKKITSVLRSHMYLTDTVVTHIEQSLDEHIDIVLERCGTAKQEVAAQSDDGLARHVLMRKMRSSSELPSPATSTYAASTVAESSSVGYSQTLESESSRQDPAMAKQSWAYSRISGYSLILITSILSMLEPSSLSKAALQAATQRGKRKESQDKLCKILQFATGLTASWSATWPYKFDEVLRAYFVALHCARGRRGMGLVLSWDMCWQELGVYRLSVENKVLLLKQPWTKAVVEVPKAIVKKLGSVLASITLEHNWSETEAVLAGPSGETHMCLLLITDHLVASGILDQFNTVDMPAMMHKHHPASDVSAQCAKEAPSDSEDEVVADDDAIQLALLAAANPVDDGYGEVKLEDLMADDTGAMAGKDDPEALVPALKAEPGPWLESQDSAWKQELYDESIAVRTKRELPDNE